MQHAGLLITGVAALAAALLISSLTVNRQVKRRLRLSLFLLSAYILLHLGIAVAARFGMTPSEQLLPFGNLAFAAGVINLLVIASINPLRADRVPDRFPTILQDFIVIGLLLLVATFVFPDKLLTTSAVSAVVIGFALQDTLGNAFAGLAIQSEKPFYVGHWIRVGEFEGRVAEVTWRATKLRTKSGNFIILPNNIVSKEAITNYSEPAIPTRLEVEVGASYESPPNQVKAAIHEAMEHCLRVLQAPAPDVVVMSFDSSAITYRARFWVEDYANDEKARDDVRTAIYYSFGRRGIEIPYPIQVQYEKKWQDADPSAGPKQRESWLAKIDLFATLTDEQRREIAASTTTRLYGDGEAIVREGDTGRSMFVVCAGKGAVMLEAERSEVATIETGGYFGEMSLLTGEPRSATVLARGDTCVIEIDADEFRRLGNSDPHAVEMIGAAAVARRTELDKVRNAASSAAAAGAQGTFIARMRKFLRL